MFNSPMTSNSQDNDGFLSERVTRTHLGGEARNSMHRSLKHLSESGELYLSRDLGNISICFIFIGGSPKLKRKTKRRRHDESAFADTHMPFGSEELPVFFIYSKYKIPKNFEILTKLTSDKILENSVYYQLNKWTGMRHSIYVDLASRTSEDPIMFGLGLNLEI